MMSCSAWCPLVQENTPVTYRFVLLQRCFGSIGYPEFGCQLGANSPPIMILTVAAPAAAHAVRRSDRTMVHLWSVYGLRSRRL